MKTNFNYGGNFFKGLRNVKKRKELRKARLEYGVSDWDAYDLKDYILTVLYNGLEVILRDRMGYPLGYTDEEWEVCLEDLKYRVECLINSDDDPEYYRFVRRKVLAGEIYGKDSDEYKRVAEQCTWYVTEYWKSYKEFKKDTFEILERVFDDLWD